MDNQLTGLTISDLHGILPSAKAINNSIPNIDIITLTGDICPNNIHNFQAGIKQGTLFTPTDWKSPWNYRKIDEIKEGNEQREWIITTLIPWLNLIPHKKTFFLNGNHDFGDFSGLFDLYLRKGTLNFEFEGFKFGCLTGVLPIQGEWFEEIAEHQFENRILELKQDIDVLLTHTPPDNILDFTSYLEHIGSTSLTKSIFGIKGIEPYFKNLQLHCFGHCHDSSGNRELDIDKRKIKFINAAQKCKKFTLKKI